MEAAQIVRTPKTAAIEPFNPATFAEAREMATLLSQSALLPTSLRKKPEDVLVILMKGRELGLSPIQALSEIYVVEGRPSASAALKTALCLQRPDVCLYFRLVESDARKAIYETKRTGSEPVRMTWTIEQAERAGLLGRSNWKHHTDAMLRARCSSALASAVYPDLVQGLVTDDEATDIREEKVITNPTFTAPPPSATTQPKPHIKAVPTDAEIVAEQPATQPGTAAAGPSPIEQILIAINEASTLDDLAKVTARITDMNVGSNPDIRKAYLGRKKVIQSGAAPSAPEEPGANG